MLSRTQRAAPSLCPLVYDEAMHRATFLQNHIHAIRPAQVAATFVRGVPPPPGLYVVDAAADLRVADDIAAVLAPFASAATRAQKLVRKSNVVPDRTAPLAVAVLASGSGDWAWLVPNPLLDHDDCLPLPKQSCQSDLVPDRPVLAGMFSIAGAALTRCDARTSFAQANIAPGDGSLRLEQIVAELLSKGAMIGKYGA